MTDAREPGSEGRGLTRQEFLLGAVAAGGVGLLAGRGSPAGARAVARASSAPRRGGTLRFGGAGGSSKDFMDPVVSFSDVDAARDEATWEPLLGTDAHGNIALNQLAEEFSTTTADVWTIRVHA